MDWNIVLWSNVQKPPTWVSVTPLEGCPRGSSYLFGWDFETKRQTPEIMRINIVIMITMHYIILIIDSKITQNSNCWSSEPFWTCPRGDGSAWEGGKSSGRRDRSGACRYQDIRLRGGEEVGVGWQYSSCGQYETSKSWHCDPAWCSCTCRQASLDSDF